MTPSKKKQIITGILMTTVMALTLSGFFSLIYMGFTLEWVGVWARNFAMGWPVGFIVSLIAAGPVQRLAGRLAD